MVGRDGVIGASSALDGKLALNRAIVQIGGSGVLCDAARSGGWRFRIRRSSR
jgi:hypothetical protein